MRADQDEIVGFGPFRLHMARRRLLCGADELRIGGRGMDVLLALAARQGELVGKQELLRAAWPDTFVQEANLKVTIAGLRRALRQQSPTSDYINTVVGRGYWLGMDEPAGGSDPPAGELISAGAALPEIREIVGRDAEIARLKELLDAERLVSIVGPGGIGKTTVASAVARDVAAHKDWPIAFVDLSGLTSEEFVAASVAAALGISSGGDSLHAVSSILARQKLLLVLDTCEHVLSAASHLCEVLLARTEHVRILTTSRTLLRVRREKVLWLTSLGVPPGEEIDQLGVVLRYPAPQLLVTRANDRTECAFEDADAMPLARICRQLDGSPLAIELVAPLLATHGAAAVLDQLEDRLLLLKRSDRAGPRRHRTLLEALKWSYSLLTAQEAAVLRICSVFAGRFRSEAAARVAAGANASPIETVDALAGLRSKSMLSIEHRGDDLHYRLLDSTRVFAADLLAENDEGAAARSAHARFVLESLDRAAVDQRTMSLRRWRNSYLTLLDDLRNALDWTLRRSADPLLGIRLVAAGLPLWQELTLGEEIRENCEHALSEFRRLGCSDTALKLRLVVGLATVSTYLSTDIDKTGLLFRSAVELAQRTGDPHAECRALGAFATYELMRCRKEAVADALASMRVAALGTRHPAAWWEQEQLRAQYEIRICDFAAALARVRRLYEEMRGEEQRAVPRFQIHQKINVQIQLAALKWLSGRPGAAVTFAASAAADARDIEHGLTLIHCLAQGVVWTLIQCGEYDAVVPHIGQLREAIYRHGIAAWIPVADTYAAVISALRGEKPDPACLRSAFYGVRAGVAQIRHDARYAMLAEAMLANGQPSDAADVIRYVFDSSRDPWGRCEFLRLQAGVERSLGRDALAEPLLREALGAAEGTGAPAWILRSASDLAALHRDRGEMRAARGVLAPALARHSDGFETRDVRNARVILEGL